MRLDPQFDILIALLDADEKGAGCQIAARSEARGLAGEIEDADAAFLLVDGVDEFRRVRSIQPSLKVSAISAISVSAAMLTCVNAPAP